MKKKKKIKKKGQHSAVSIAIKKINKTLLE